MATRLPKSKIGKEARIPTPQMRLGAENHLLNELLAKPMFAPCKGFELNETLDPVKENCGKRLATATPICSLAAAICLSALLISGRRRKRSEGRPNGIFPIAKGIALERTNCSKSDSGGRPRRI